MKKQIAIVTGGYSGEAVISYKSARTIFNHIDREKFQPYLIDISRDGWFYEDEQGRRSPVDRNDFSILLNGQRQHFDAALIAMHGTPGEDGKLQGYFDMLGLPYTGCSAACSAITFNKSYATGVAAKGGVSVARSLLLFDHSPLPAGKILEQLRLPLFVKPNNGGSSIGMSKVMQADELQGAIEKAFREDSQVLVEEMIEGREFTIGVYRSKGQIITLPFTEVKAHDSKEFFDFEAKYEGKSTEVTPAEVAEPIAEKVREAAKKVYELFNCKGVIRIDFIYEETSASPFMLEVNTIPGQSDASIIPQQVAAAGGNLKDFYSLLVAACFE
ncbi:D-alanine--D-alanine ligase [Niabella terrae]